MSREATQSPFTEYGYTFRDTNLTVREAFELAKLDFQVEERPIIRATPAIVQELGNLIAAREAGQTFNFDGLNNLLSNVTTSDLLTSHKAVCRSDNGLNFGVPKQTYKVIQNDKALGFIDYLEEVAGKPVQMISGGSFDGGRRIFLTCRLGDEFCMGDEGDNVIPYILFTTAHDGSGAVKAVVTTVRVICQNTLAMALRGSNRSNSYIVKHTKNGDKRLDFTCEENRHDAAKVFEMTKFFMEDFIKAMTALRTEQVDGDYCRRFIGNMLLNPQQYAEWEKANYRIEVAAQAEGKNSKPLIATKMVNLFNDLYTSIHDGIGQGNYRGTKLWLLNGVTTWLQNDYRVGKQTTEERFLSMSEGTAADYTQKAYDLLIA